MAATIRGTAQPKHGRSSALGERVEPGGATSTGVFAEPRQHPADAPFGEGEAGVGRAVVEPQRVAVGAEGVAAREGDVRDVALALVDGRRAEDPRVAAGEARLRLVEREERRAEPVER